VAPAVNPDYNTESGPGQHRPDVGCILIRSVHVSVQELKHRPLNRKGYSCFAGLKNLPFAKADTEQKNTYQKKFIPSKHNPLRNKGLVKKSATEDTKAGKTDKNPRNSQNYPFIETL
jgi:hypothetical protein